MEPELQKRLDNIENEIEELKTLVIFRASYGMKTKLVSFRGMAKQLVSDRELKESIEKAKHSLFGA